MSDRWLAEVLHESVARRYCTQIHCHTCGALEFKQFLLSALARANPVDPPRHLSPRLVSALSPALRALDGADGSRDTEQAVRFILYQLWSGVPGLDLVLEEGMAGSWVAQVLDRMKAHHAARLRAREDAAQAPARAAARREARRQINQARHTARLVAKAERDRLWHAQHPPGN